MGGGGGDAVQALLTRTKSGAVGHTTTEDDSGDCAMGRAFFGRPQASVGYPAAISVIGSYTFARWRPQSMK